MRPIKFRVKGRNNQWHYGYPLIYNDESFSFVDYEKLNDDRTPLELCTLEYIEYDTLGEFTGLCDKNGKKIYEGDIIKSHYGSIYIVKYLPDWCSFSLKLVFLNTEGKLSRATGRQHLYKNDCTRLEILGNIWDDPDLLGGSDEECDN